MVINLSLLPLIDLCYTDFIEIFKLLVKKYNNSKNNKIIISIMQYYKEKKKIRQYHTVLQTKGECINKANRTVHTVQY